MPRSGGRRQRPFPYQPAAAEPGQSWEDYVLRAGITLPSKRSPKLSGAVELLRQSLWHGPCSERTLRTAAAAAGIGWRTVKKAKRLLGVESRRVGWGPGSHMLWVLPPLRGMNK